MEELFDPLSALVYDSLGMEKTSSSHLWLRTLCVIGMTMRARCGNSVIRFGGKLR